MDMSEQASWNTEPDPVVMNLMRAKALIMDRNNWCTMTLHQFTGGRVQYCAEGALQKVLGYRHEYTDEYTHLSRAALMLFGTFPDNANDHFGHSAVMQMYDKAIELAARDQLTCDRTSHNMGGCVGNDTRTQTPTCYKGVDMKVQARTKEKPTPVEVEADIPSSTEDLVKKFGAEVVNKAALAQIVISLQAFMRRLIEKGKSTEEIQSEVDKWKPDVRSIVKQTAFEKVTSNLSALSEAERKDLLAKLQAAVAQEAPATKAPARATAKA